MEKNKQSKILFRYFLISAVVVLMCCFVVVKVVKITFFEREGWDKKSKELIHREEIKGVRGNILSANDEILATTIKEYQLFFDFRQSKENGVYVDRLNTDTLKKYIKPLSIALAQKLQDKSAEEYEQLITNAHEQKLKRFRLSKKWISYLDLLEIKEFPLLEKGRDATGFFEEEQERRERPFGGIAARTIGRMKLGKAEYGIELAYDSILKGKNGEADFKMTRKEKIEVRGTKIDAEHGCDIRTTIDLKIQRIAEQALMAKMREVDADDACVIVMEVKTGAIRAIVNYERVSEGKYREARNRAISAMYQPGSTFKTVSVMAALDDGVTTPNEIFDTGNGVYKHVNPKNGRHKEVRDWNYNKGGFGPISVTKIMEQSSNVGTVKIVLKGYENNPQKFLDKLDEMGISHKVDLKMIGQAYPVIPNQDSKIWSYTTLPWMSFGYNIQIPPIYSLMYYNAIANGGKMISPIFVTDILKNGEVVEHINAEVIREQICSPKALKEVQEILTSVVQNGTAKCLISPTVPIAGKTGTVVISRGENGYDEQKRTHRVSFCGYFPDDSQPKYSCIVVVSRPRGIYPSAGPIAGGVLKEIAEKMYTQGYIYNATIPQPDTEEAKRVEAKRGIDDITKSAYNSMNITYTADTTRNDIEFVTTIQNNNTPKTENDSTILPSVIGMGLKDAIYILEKSGVKVTINGQGVVKTQNPEPGEIYKNGDKVTITLE